MNKLRPVIKTHMNTLNPGDDKKNVVFHYINGSQLKITQENILFKSKSIFFPFLAKFC